MPLTNSCRRPAAAPGPAGVALHVGEGGFDRARWAALTSGGDLLAAERPGQGDRLGRGEGEIEAGDRATAGDGSSGRAARRWPGCIPVSIADELVGLDLAVEAELVRRRRRATGPAASPSPE